MNKGKHRIVVTEIPYQVNKARVIESIADLSRNKEIDGITALRDESDRKGMRIVVELRADVNPDIVLNKLYKHTQLQETFGVIMLALVDGHPRVLTLKQILNYYLDHQKDVITRRSKFELDKAWHGLISWKACSLPWTTSTKSSRRSANRLRTMRQNSL